MIFFGMVLKSKIVVDDGKFPKADRDLSGGESASLYLLILGNSVCDGRLTSVVLNII